MVKTARLFLVRRLVKCSVCICPSVMAHMALYIHIVHSPCLSFGRSVSFCSVCHWRCGRWHRVVLSVIGQFVLLCARLAVRFCYAWRLYFSSFA